MKEEIFVAQPVDEMTYWEIIKSKLFVFLIRLRRKLPHLVWDGEEVDVVVTLKEIGRLEDDLSFSKDIASVHELQRIFRELGIDFDSGSGRYGRDWEWDYSLKGPISVRFRRRASKPHLRTAVPPKPKLRLIK